MAQRIVAMTGRSLDDCLKEVDLSIQRLFYWGAYADKYGGLVQVGVVMLGGGSKGTCFVTCVIRCALLGAYSNPMLMHVTMVTLVFASCARYKHVHVSTGTYT